MNAAFVRALLLLLVALPFLSPLPAWAGVRRFALAAGNNEGTPGMDPLFFAEDDFAMELLDLAP